MIIVLKPPTYASTGACVILMRHFLWGKMKIRANYKISWIDILSVLLAGLIWGGGCDKGEDEATDDSTGPCDIGCPSAGNGLLAGNYSISGVAAIDGFLQSVVGFGTKADNVSADIDTALKSIYGTVGLDVAFKTGADLDLADRFQSSLAASFYLDMSSGSAITVEYHKPDCEVSASASIEATAKCDVDVDPVKVNAICAGECEVDAQQIDLYDKCADGSDAQLRCTGIAPGLICAGSCTGDCVLHVAAACDGVCYGSCNGVCALENADGVCAGQCDGTCLGTCKMESGDVCDGQCVGTCKYTPADGVCTGGAIAEIFCESSDAAEMLGVECNTTCRGKLTPPHTTAVCEASARAENDLEAECAPPVIDVFYQFDQQAIDAAIARGEIASEADAKAQFRAWLFLFKVHMGALLAATAQADIVVKAGENMISAAGNVVAKAGTELAASGDLDLATTYKLTTCLPPELKKVPGIIGDASDRLTASVDASVSLLDAVTK
ncbi:MAG: hypothetical protein JXX14_24040 [Deltaproteobacteria bacterium]|nr:hypothetical protein [Deltaproteobacteria bacterium]